MTDKVGQDHRRTATISTRSTGRPGQGIRHRSVRCRSRTVQKPLYRLADSSRRGSASFARQQPNGRGGRAHLVHPPAARPDRQRDDFGDAVRLERIIALRLEISLTITSTAYDKTSQSTSASSSPGDVLLRRRRSVWWRGSVGGPGAYSFPVNSLRHRRRRWPHVPFRPR